MKGVTNPDDSQSVRLKFRDLSLPARKTAFASTCASWKVMGYCHNPVPTLWGHLWRPWNWEISLAPSARIAANCVQMFQIEVAIEVAYTPEWEQPRDVGSVQCYGWRNYGLILPLEQMGAQYCQAVVVPTWEFSLPPDWNETTEEGKREIPVELKGMWRLLHIQCWCKCFRLTMWCLNLRSLPWP